MAVASSSSTSCATSISTATTTTSSTPQQQQQQHMMSPVQNCGPPQQQMQPTSTPIQQVVVPQPPQQQTMQLPPCSSYTPATTTTTTSLTVRSSYKPIAPAPPQQQQHQSNQQQQPGNLIAMTPMPQQQNDKNTTDQQQQQQHPQILTIPVGSAVYPIGMAGTHNIRSPLNNNFQTMNGGDPHSQLSVHMPASGSSTTCFIANSPTVTTSSRMSTPLGGGLITVGPAAPLSAMANMTVPASSATTSNGPTRTTAQTGSLQPVTVAVSAQSTFPLPSPVRQSMATEKPDEPKASPRATTATPSKTVAEEETSSKKESQMNGDIHSPALREKKEPNLPQAVVRPQILTHVLGDFVIQESSEPFPVGRFHPNDPLTKSNGHRNNENNSNFNKMDGEPPSKIFNFLFFLVLHFFS